ncbi:MAG: transglycosylase domain-containing protein [Eubacterium sp.]|nr:transglycosylase domain-containing protein [Eubacterium sp.]
MKFSRHGIEQKREELQATAPRAGNRIVVFILRILIFLLIAVVVGGIFLFYGAYRGIIDESPQITDANIMPLGYASFVYDADGDEIQKLNSVEGNRVMISINEIPKDMQNAIVAIEDSRFYEHNGVDPHGMIRAILVAVQSGLSRSEGASTITQQLLKNNVFTDWMNETRIQRIKRKLQEQYLAVQLEESLKEAGENPKEVILENYLNTVNFGSGAYGVQTAAQTYFGKDAKDLTLSECAVLAAIPQNPSQYNPKIYPEDNAVRMRTILDYMLDQGYITKEQHDEALADNVYTRIVQTEELKAAETEIYSYFVDQLIEQVKEGLMREKGFTESQATNAIYNGGLRIYSTEDAAIQEILEEEFADADNFPTDSMVGLDWALTVDHADGSRENYSREMMQTWFRENGYEDFDLNFDSEADAQLAIDTYKEAILGATDEIIAERTDFIPQPQACMTIIDQATGEVKGIVGGRGEKTASLTLNRATDSLREPGTTLTIPSTYAPALELNKVNLATRMTDDEYLFDSTEPVSNDDKEHYGDMRVRDAVITSNNVIAAKVFSYVTTNVGFDYLQKLGISTLVDSTDGDLNQSISLGRLSEGMTNIELTAAYAAIANGGSYNKPIFYTKVTDRVGNVLLQNNPSPSQVFQNTTSYLITNVLQDTITRGTAGGYRLSNSSIAVAGKTGTTQKYVDLTFVGYTPYYTAGIWTGYDTYTSLSETQRDYIRTLWVNVMNRIHNGLPGAGFTVPAGISQATICAESGLLAGKGCTTTTEIFASGAVPTSVCTEHAPAPTPIPTPFVLPTPAPTAAPQPETPETPEQPEQPEVPVQPEVPEQPEVPVQTDPAPVDNGGDVYYADNGEVYYLDSEGNILY